MDQDLGTSRPDVDEIPPPVRLAVLGATLAGVLGGLVGLVLGLRAYPPTAWFAVLEVGVPSALVGALLGLVAGAATCLLRPH